MRCVFLAPGYEGIKGCDGEVDEPTLVILGRLGRVGCDLILVTGQKLDDLVHCTLWLNLFDRVVARNAALLYWPATN